MGTVANRAQEEIVSPKKAHSDSIRNQLVPFTEALKSSGIGTTKLATASIKAILTKILRNPHIFLKKTTKLSHLTITQLQSFEMKMRRKSCERSNL